MLLAGCAVNPGTSDDSTRMNETMAYRGWSDAVRLTNGTVELVVVPSIGGRVIRYGYVGGENLLWENEKLAGRGPSTKPYHNFGGEKAWPWPQDDWKQLIGRVWPPPTAHDQSAFTCERLNERTVRLTSGVAPEVGVRLVREIRLDERGTRVTLESRLVPEPGSTKLPTVAPWHVAQLPSPDVVLARVGPGAGEPPFRPLAPHPPAVVERVGREILVIRQPDGKAAKIGLDADLLAWVKGSTFLVQRLQPAPDAPADVPGERAQVFFQEDTHPPQNYLELEFAAPRGAGGPYPLRVTWDLHDLPRDLKTPDALAGYLRALP